MKLTPFFTKAIILSFIFIFWRGTKNEAQAQINQLWGLTARGGVHCAGIIFTTDISGNNQTVEHDFYTPSEGSSPFGSLMIARDGKLYGMTSSGGKNMQGVLFQYDPDSLIYINKLDFKDTITGANPFGSLIQASDGKLYGMTSQGGINNMGVLFQYDPATSIYSKKLDFAGITNGANPSGSLIQASDGKLYGMTRYGGINNNGVLFQYDPIASIYIKQFDFAGVTNGALPEGSLLQTRDGNLYGMTLDGGANGMGVLFQYDLTTYTYTKKLDFAGTINGRYPRGSLIQAKDGKLYGMTEQGGAYSLGVLFQYDPATSTCTKKLDFDGNGGSPEGSLMQASNGKMYGMTIAGGPDDKGVLFQYDPVTSTYVKKLNFTATIWLTPFTGYNPHYTSLIEINPVAISSIEKEVGPKLYPNPAHDFLTLELLLGNQKSATVIIENMFGQIMYETQINTSFYQINTEHYARGIYLVKIITNDETITKKIIVE